MIRFALSLILVFNSFVLAACSGYKTAAVPTDPDSGAVAESKAPELKEGQHARVYLRSGEMHEGEVVAVSETQVTLLGQPTNRGYREHAFEIVDSD